MRNLERNSASSNYVANSVNAVGGGDFTGSRRPWCWIHPEENTHPIWRCLEFSGKPPKERIDLVRNNNACYRCLEQGHSSRFCRKRFTCRTDNCGQQHHYLLHEAIRSGQSNHGQQIEGEGDVLLLLQRVKSRSLQGGVETRKYYVGRR